MAVLLFATRGLPRQQGEGQIMSGGLEAVINTVLTESALWLQGYSFRNCMGNAEHALTALLQACTHNILCGFQRQTLLSIRQGLRGECHV